MITVVVGTDPNRHHFRDYMTIHFNYINKEESAFLLGVLKHVECCNCPCFHEGCEGDYSAAQLGNMASREYIYTQKKGTEIFLCGKLRTIVIADDMRSMEIEKSFDASIKQNIGYLNKLVDKCVLRTANYDLEIKSVEYALQKKLDAIVEEHAKMILSLQSALSDKEKEMTKLENELNNEKMKNSSDVQYNQKMHQTIEQLQRTIFEQNQQLSKTLK
jgi:hypothetical protein